MINFLRKLGKKSSSGEMKPGFVFYALGEILLVVVGILIALQINNWNEARKDHQIEQQILKEIRQDLIETLENDLVEDIAAHHEILWSTHLIKNAIVEGRSYHDSLDRHLLNAFTDTRTYYKSAGYNGMLSKGAHIISNDSLRIWITDLYELGFPRLDESAEEYEHRKVLAKYRSRHFTLSNEIRIRDYSEYLDDTLFVYRYDLNSFDLLKADSEFVIELQNSQYYRRRKIRRCFWTRNQILKIVKGIDEYVGNLTF